MSDSVLPFATCRQPARAVSRNHGHPPDGGLYDASAGGLLGVASAANQGTLSQAGARCVSAIAIGGKTMTAKAAFDTNELNVLPRHPFIFRPSKI